MIGSRMLKIAFITASFIFSSAFAAANNSPIGFWKTIDDVTGKPKSIVEIYETSDHTLSAKVLHIFPKPGDDQHKLCDACKGDKHNQPIVGMVILEGMAQQDNQWEGGKILDPSNGKTYRCTLKTTNDGNNLQVHGYIGLPILGRTQTWARITEG